MEGIITQVLSVQQLLENSDLVNVLQSLSSLDEQGRQQNYVRFFCGNSRRELSPLLWILLTRNNYGDPNKKGTA